MWDTFPHLTSKQPTITRHAQVIHVIMYIITHKTGTKWEWESCEGDVWIDITYTCTKFAHATRVPWTAENFPQQPSKKTWASSQDMTYLNVLTGKNIFLRIVYSRYRTFWPFMSSHALTHPLQRRSTQRYSYGWCFTGSCWILVQLTWWMCST